MEAAASVERLPGPIRAWGWFAGIGSVFLAAELVWEQTILSWARGPQMVGFSLAHSFFLGLILFPLLLGVWIVLVLGASIRSRFRGKAIRWQRIAAVLCGLAPLAIITAPYGLWQRLFAAQIANSGFANEFITLNAATGDVATMESLVAHAGAIDARSSDGETLLHIAARLGHLKVIAFLAAHGADPNVRDQHGDTPLDEALSFGQTQAAQLLMKQFGDRLEAPRARVDEPVHVTVRPEPSP